MTRRLFFLIGLLLECVCIFGLFLPLVMRVSSGKEITLLTIPVDPRSIFRGDYVALNYEAGGKIPDTVSYGSPTYVVLAKDPKGDTWDRLSYGPDKPTLQAGQMCLYGRIQYQRITFPDIAQYFVEEGLGLELEKARNNHRLLVTASVDSGCHAIITGVIVGPEVTPAEQQAIDQGNMPPQGKPVPVEMK